MAYSFWRACAGEVTTLLGPSHHDAHAIGLHHGDRGFLRNEFALRDDIDDSVGEASLAARSQDGNGFSDHAGRKDDVIREFSLAGGEGRPRWISGRERETTLNAGSRQIARQEHDDDA